MNSNEQEIAEAVVYNYRRGHSIRELSIFYAVPFDTIVENLKKGYEGEIIIK